MSQTKRKNLSMSKRLKNMKFMKRKSNSQKRKTKEADKKHKIETMQWIQSEASESNLIIDDRMDEYMMYKTGRKSFGDFNVSVQRMEQTSISMINDQLNQSSNSELTKINKIKSNNNNNDNNDNNGNKNKNNNTKNKNVSKKRSFKEFSSTNTNKPDASLSGNVVKRQKIGFIQPEPLQ